MIRLACALLIAVAAAVGIAGQSAEAADPESNKIVVELFTSQGCSSCPPADAFLGELAKREDLLPLSFHVDYWNYIGWKDPFSLKEAAHRQRAYRPLLKKRYVYTPQVVVDGRHEAVGSDRTEVKRLIALSAAEPHPAKISISHPRDGIAEVMITPTADADLPPSVSATVWLALYDARHETEIGSGENRGRKIVNTNVVRTFKKVGKWRGGRQRITVPLEALGSRGRDGCAIIVQSDSHGRILGAVAIPLSGGKS